MSPSRMTGYSPGCNSWRLVFTVFITVRYNNNGGDILGMTGVEVLACPLSRQKADGITKPWCMPWIIRNWVYGWRAVCKVSLTCKHVASCNVFIVLWDADTAIPQALSTYARNFRPFHVSLHSSCTLSSMSRLIARANVWLWGVHSQSRQVRQSLDWSATAALCSRRTGTVGLSLVWFCMSFNSSPRQTAKWSGWSLCSSVPLTIQHNTLSL